MAFPGASPPGEAELLEHLAAVRALIRQLVAGERSARLDVDDVLQETLTRAWRSRGSFDPGRSMAAWLKRIAFHVFLDQRERARRAPRALGERSDAIESCPAPSVAARLDLEAALSRLTPLQQDVLLRFHRGGQRVTEIAVDLDLPEGTVKSILRRARLALAEADTEEEA